MRVSIQFQGPGFVAVPNHVAAMVPALLSAEALGALVRMALLPIGSDWNVSTVCKLAGLSRRAWERVSRELRAVGALRDDPFRGDDGKVRGRVLSVCWPEKPKRERASSVPKTTKTETHKTCASSAQKPKRTKRVFRSSQVIEVLDKNDSDVPNLSADIKTKTGEAVAVAPTGGKAAAASPVCPSSLTRFERDRLLTGLSVVLGGVLVKPDAPEWAAFMLLVRAQAAEKLQMRPEWEGRAI